jgi:hypothetical protein
MVSKRNQFRATVRPAIQAATGAALIRGGLLLLISP